MPPFNLKVFPDWARPYVSAPDASSMVNEMAVPGPGAAAGLVGPLISIYKNKAAREAAGSELISQARGASAKLGAAYEAFAAKYPRIAAHMRPFLASQDDWGLAHTYPGPVTQPVTVTLAKDLTTDMPEVLRHEAAHVAQALGNRDFNQMYDMADRVFGGWTYNPYEATARIAQAAKSPDRGIAFGGMGDLLSRRVPRVNAHNQILRAASDPEWYNVQPDKADLLNELVGMVKKRRGM